MVLELYDCTLRDGEQAAGASFSLEDRLHLFKLLDNFGFDYIELGWPVSREVQESFKQCNSIKKRAKISAFGSTAKNNPSEDFNLNSIISVKPDIACIFGKSSITHVLNQLKTTPEKNLLIIRDSIDYLKQANLPVFYDAEHFFDGFKEDKDYALQTLVEAFEIGAERLILCDTNGGTLPEDLEDVVKTTYNYLSRRFRSPKIGIHLHNDQGLAVPGSLRVLDYISQVQGTINGLGERVGNMDFSNFLPIYLLKYGGKKDLDLKKLKRLHDESFRLSGRHPSESKPFVGDLAFTHKGGVHIDALIKKGASYEFFDPQLVGNIRKIDLNTLGGAASVLDTARQFGYALDKQDPITQKGIKDLYLELKTMEEQGFRNGTILAEQYLLVEKYFGNLQHFFDIISWQTKIGMKERKEFSEIELNIELSNKIKTLRKSSLGGPVDLLYKSLHEGLLESYPCLNNLHLSDFHVEIARRRGEESTVRTLIEFSTSAPFQTVGVNSNIIHSATQALEKGFRYFLNVYKNK